MLNDLKLLFVQNLFKYYCTSEIFKIMKFRCPYPLYDKINISNRDTSLTIILSEKNNTFLYVAAQIWNSIHKQIVKSDNGLETSVSLVKVRVKSLILDCQAAGERTTGWMKISSYLLKFCHRIFFQSPPLQHCTPLLKPW